MKKLIKNKTFRVIIGLLVFGALVAYPISQITAADLDTPRIYLNRLDPNLTSGEQFEIFFTTQTAVTGGVGANKVIFIMPDADDDDWCETAGAGTATGITDPTGGSETASALPGTLTVTCTQGVGGSSYDTFTISGVNDLAGTTKYGVRVTDTGAGAYGTPAAGTTGIITIKTNDGGSDIDESDTAIDIVADDEIAVTATVPPSITFTISANSVALGTLATGAVSTGSHTIRTETNAANGYTSMIYDSGNLADGGNDINDVADGAVTAGAEEYGVSTTDNGQTILQDGGGGCSGATFEATSLTTTQKTVAGEAAGPADETETVCYMASIDSSTLAGSYSHTVYLITTGLF